MNKIIIVSASAFTCKELQQYEQQILDNPNVTERDASEFFSHFPKFLTVGGYKEIAREVILYKPDGSEIYRVDFCRRRFGKDYWDFVELKSPKVPFIVKRGNHWQFSSHFESGIHQALDYRDFVEETGNRLELERRMGIKAFRPKLLLIGARRNNNISQDDLVRLTSRYNNIDIQTYDDIYNFAVDNFQLSCIVVPVLQSSDIVLPDEQARSDSSHIRIIPKPADTNVEWVLDGQFMVRNPDRGDDLYHADGVIYYDGDPIDENGLFFADGTRASEEDVFYIYYWPRALG